MAAISGFLLENEAFQRPIRVDFYVCFFHIAQTSKIMLKNIW